MLGAASRLRWGGLRSVAVIAVLLALATGCDTAADSEGRNGTPDLSAPSDTNSTHAVSDRDAVVAAYDEFWERTHSVPHDSESTWDDEMAEVAVDPQLSITLQGMRLAKQRGSTSYGDVTSRVAAVDINGDQATVVDCQDASKSGQKDAKSGKKKTVGVERNPVKARMHRDDGQWKVAEISYPGGDC